MIFSRIRSSLSRSSRFRNVINGANRGRSLLNGNSKQIDENLMFVRGYLSTIGASKRPFSRTFLSDFNHSTANPKVSRFFSTQAPKKIDYDDFYRKSRFRGFKEGGNRKTFFGHVQNAAFYLLVFEWLFSPFSSSLRAGQQISYQEFENKFLKPGLVDRIVVSNASVAKVYVRRSPQNQSRYDTIEGGKSSQTRYKYYFDIGIGYSFEEMLEKAQEAMGIDPRDYVPVTYVSEIDWRKAIMWSCLIIWLC